MIVCAWTGFRIGAGGDWGTFLAVKEMGMIASVDADAVVLLPLSFAGDE